MGYIKAGISIYYPAREVVYMYGRPTDETAKKSWFLSLLNEWKQKMGEKTKERKGKQFHQVLKRGFLVARIGYDALAHHGPPSL